MPRPPVRERLRRRPRRVTRQHDGRRRRVRLTVVDRRFFAARIDARSDAARVDWRADQHSLDHTAIDTPPRSPGR